MASSLASEATIDSTGTTGHRVPTRRRSGTPLQSQYDVTSVSPSPTGASA